MLRQFRPSVRPSHACFASKRLNISSKSFHYLIGPSRGRGTYTAWTVNFVPLLKVERKSVYLLSHFWWFYAPKCTKVHRFAPYIFKNVPGVIPPDLQPPETPPPQYRPPSYFFRASAAAGPIILGSLRTSDGFTPDGGAEYKGVAIFEQ